MSCSSLHELLMNYSQRVMHQLAQSAVCNRFHTSVQRLARWLLLTAERAETTRFELTHELLAQMVGAPRSAVSQAASTLRDQGHHRLPPRRPHHPQHGAPAQGRLRVLRRRVAGGRCSCRGAAPLRTAQA